MPIDTEAEARALLDPWRNYLPQEFFGQLVARVTAALHNARLEAHAAGKAEGERIGEAKGLRRAAQILESRKPQRANNLHANIRIELSAAQVHLESAAAELERAGKEGKSTAATVDKVRAFLKEHGLEVETSLNVDDPFPSQTAALAAFRALWKELESDD